MRPYSRVEDMVRTVEAAAGEPATPIELVEDFERWVSGQDATHLAWLEAQRFKGKPGQSCALPGPNGIAKIVVGFDPVSYTHLTLPTSTLV